MESLAGGLQGGPRRGRSPITGPALQHAAQAAKITNKEKALAHAGRQKTYLKEQALSHPSLLQRKAAQCIGAPPQDGKIPIPKDKPFLSQSLRITQYRPPRGGPPTAEASFMSGNRRFPSHTHAQDPKP